MPFPPRLRKSLKWIGIVLISLSLVVVTLAVFLPLGKIADRQARAWLTAHDIPLEYELAGFSLKGLELKGVSFRDSEDFLLPELTVEYAPSLLWTKRIGTIAAVGLDLILRQQEDGSIQLAPTTPFIDQFLTPDESVVGFKAPVLPFERLVLRDALLTYYPLEGEPIQAVFNGTLNWDYSGQFEIIAAHIPLNDGSTIELADVSLERQNTSMPFIFGIGRISHKTEGKAYFTPMHALGEINAARDLSTLDGMIVISDLIDRWKLNLTGKADMNAQSWSMDIDQPPVFFESGILQPDQLFPFLRGKVKDASGSFAISGSVSKEAGAEVSASKGTFTFGNVGLTANSTAIRGINGTLEFSSLFPLATKGIQTISVEAINLGLPLTGGSLKFSLDKKGNLAFAPTAWNWAGGKLTTSAAKGQLSSLSISGLTLSVKDLSVQELLSSMLKSGFSATGTMNGKLPITFKDGAPLIRKGKLETPGGGIISYVPPEGESPIPKGQSFQTDLLLSAISNFHYDTLSFDIDNKDERILEVILHLRGRNPDLYNGQIIELNINLTGNILEAVQSSLDIYSLPERLEEQFNP